MILIIFTGLLAACTAASLEHLEKKQISYLPAAKDSSSPSKVSDVESFLGADTNTISASTDGQPGLSARTSISGSSKFDPSSDKELSSSESDSEFAGYFYGPGVQNLYNQKSKLQAHSQFGTRTPNQQFDQQGTNKYSSQQNHNQIFSTQGSNQQFGQQQQNQQFGQQTHSQHFGQQTQKVNQQQQNQHFRQQAYSQQFGQQPLSQQPLMQQYYQQSQNQQYGNLGSQLNQHDASPQGNNNFRAQVRYQPQPSFVNNQKSGSHSSQNYPQQAFDEETGYHY